MNDAHHVATALEQHTEVHFQSGEESVFAEEKVSNFARTHSRLY